MGAVLSSQNPLIQNYAFYSSVLVTKMLLMAPLTSYRRTSKKVFISPEDGKFFGGKSSDDKVKYDPDVERVRRAHLNDLENIPAFIFVAGLYLLTNPDPTMTAFLMKIYTGARILHTAVYAWREVPQPTRGILWAVGYGITLYMAGSVMCHFM